MCLFFYIFIFLQFGNQSDLLKEELNIWTRNYIDVNSLVTEKFMMQKALDKAKTDFESLMKKYQDLEQKHKKILTEYSAVLPNFYCRYIEPLLPRKKSLEAIELIAERMLILQSIHRQCSKEGSKYS